MDQIKSYMDAQSRSDVRNGMRIDWDVPIEMDDGIVLRCDVYRPIAEGKYPVIMSYGPYGKYVHFQDLYAEQYRRMMEGHPDVAAGSSNKYQNWEVVDPEKWVCDDYVCVRVDSRGAGRSPGVLDLWSAREAKGVNTTILKKKTGFKENNIRAILSRLKKQGKIKTEEKGIYYGA